MQTNLRKILADLSRQMRSKFQNHLSLKHTLLCSLLLLFLILTMKVTFFSSTTLPPPTGSTMLEVPLDGQFCNKIPPSLSQAIIHYSTSSITPQQTFKEISVTAHVLAKRSPCNFLVFGLGHDSLMWASLNHGGWTVFLEEDKAWIDTVRKQMPSLESHHVVYNTKVNQADELMIQSTTMQECMTVHEVKNSQCQLSLKELPEFVHEIEWDLIMVDAPTGYFAEAPGRMGAIYTAGMMARGRREGETHVFVHDVDRPVEDKFSKAFLCEGYLTEQEGRLRHFTIPSHKSTASMPFCP